MSAIVTDITQSIDPVCGMTVEPRSALLLFGLSWWTALLAALLLVYPAVMAWGVIEISLDARRARRRSQGGL